MKKWLGFILCGLSLSAAHAVGEENYLTHLAKNPLKKDEAKDLTQHIPKDILDNLILPRLDGKSLGNFAQACKNFNKITQDFQIKRYVDMLLDPIAIDEQELRIINQHLILSKNLNKAKTNFLKEAEKLNFLSVKANSLQESFILQNMDFIHQGKRLKQENEIRKLDFKTALYRLLSQRSDFYVTEVQKQKLIEEYKRMAQNLSGYVFYGEKDWETEISKANTIVLTQSQINKNSLDKLKPHFQKKPSLKLLINIDLVANSPEKSNPHSENVLSLQSLQDIDFIKHLIITDTNGHITRIPKKFQLKHLESLELYLPKLKKIHSYFMTGCESLTSFTLHATNLIEIDDDFMCDCESLQTFTLYAPKLTKIAMNFMRDCISLKTFTLYAPKLTKIAMNFMRDCINLKTFTLYAPKLTEIGYDFMSRCTSLKSIKFLGKPKIKKIKDGFFGKSSLSKDQIEKTKNELMPSMECIIQ